jgi:hypothetical protein
LVNLVHFLNEVRFGGAGDQVVPTIVSAPTPKALNETPDQDAIAPWVFDKAIRHERSEWVDLCLDLLR